MKKEKPSESELCGSRLITSEEMTTKKSHYTRPELMIIELENVTLGSTCTGMPDGVAAFNS